MNVLQNDTITSYSILITRDENPGNVVENLVIQINQNNQTTANIIKYTSNIELYNGFDMDLFQGTKSITPIEYNANTVDSTAKIVYVEECTDVVIWHCYGPGGHTSSEGCTMGYATIETVCYDVAVNTGGGLPGDGAGGSLSDIIITAPNSGGGGGADPELKTPCSQLKKKTSDDPNYMTKFNQLNISSNYTAYSEKGFAEKKENGQFIHVDLIAEGRSALRFPSGSLNFTHVHNNHDTINNEGDELDSAVKMLSPDDLGCLLITCQAANINAGLDVTESFGIMLSNEGNFAITLLEPFTPPLDFNLKWIKFAEKYLFESKKIIENLSLTPEQRKKKLEKMFLEGIKKLGLENKVGLFEGEVTNQNGTNQLKWTRKALSASNSVVKTPC